MQDRGLIGEEEPQTLTLEPIVIEGADNNGSDKDPKRFKVFGRQSMNFALWWLADAKNGVANRRLPAGHKELHDAFRVAVQFQSFQDHVTITFYMDAAKPYGGDQIHSALATPLGERRTTLSNHLEDIRKSSYEEITSGRIDRAESAKAEQPRLDLAVDYFYSKVWQDFRSAFGFDLAIAGQQHLECGVVFLDQYGLMMSMRGLRTEEDEGNCSPLLGTGVRRRDSDGWDCTSVTGLIQTLDGSRIA